MTDDRIERLKNYLEFCPDSGEFTWKLRRGGVSKGKVAGYINSLGYVHIGFEGKGYLGHRLAWLFYFGRLPEKLIDHINGNKSDNRIKNLREVNREENQFNRHKTVAESGFIGVHRSRNRWRARIHHYGNRVELGSFDTPEEARIAYLTAKKTMHEIGG